MNQDLSSFPKDITPANFSYIIEGLGEGEMLTVKREKGELKFSIRAKELATRSLNNRLSFALNREPVHQGWMAYSEDASYERKKVRPKHKVELNKKDRSSESRKEMLRASLILELEGMNIGDASIVQRSTSSYYQFELGPFVVLTRADKTPVSVQEKTGGDIIFL